MINKEQAEYFKWLLNANADYIDASLSIREFIEKVIWQIDKKMEDQYTTPPDDEPQLLKDLKLMAKDLERARKDIAQIKDYFDKCACASGYLVTAPPWSKEGLND